MGTSRRTSGLRTLSVLIGACLLLLAGCAGTSSRFAPDGADLTAPAPVTLSTNQDRHSVGVIASAGPTAPYNYAPSVLQVGSGYRMWWCSQLPGVVRPGDQIVYATANSMNGPFTGPDAAAADEVFGNSATGFDTLHTCDPSVIAIGGTYYLYYTGTGDPAGRHNAIGLAMSTDGIHWTRANGGRPIVTPANDTTVGNPYGVGQPSAVYVDGWYYLLFTDTTGRAAESNGNGQFVLRSTDPAFGSNVQALDDNGFVSVPNTASPRPRSVFDGTSADWMWVDALNVFAIADDTGQGTQITFWDAGFRYHPYRPVALGGAWQDGPGLVRRADGHAPVDEQDPCGTVPLDVVRATQSPSAPTGLTHLGLDIAGVHGCSDPTRALDVLNGFAMPAPDRTVDLLVGGKLVDIERRSVALVLAQGMLGQSVPVLANVPVVTRLAAGAMAITAPGRPVGLLLDGRLWVVGSATVAQLDSSPITTVATGQWDAYPRGTDLSGLRY